MTEESMPYVDDLLDMTEDSLDGTSKLSEIASFFAGANVLVTGGSGFVGKLLVEKLLRCCPDIARLFFIMRPKKGNSPEERLTKQFDNVLYDRLRKEQPNFYRKIVMIEGDVGNENLGLSKECRNILLSTNVIFHAAATVRFDDTVRFATYVNIRGTKELLELAKEMPNMKAFVYISTAFSHCIHKFIEEKYYKPPIEPRKLLQLTEILDDKKLDVLKNSILGKYPNTYAFTKATTEALVREYSEAIPLCIVRPSIMIPTAKDPITGWIDNLYGATGVCVGAALGVLRTLHCDSSKIADVIPADYVISAIVAAAWDTGNRWKIQSTIANSNLDSDISDINKGPIYNLISSCQKPITWGEYMNYNELYGKRLPSTKVVWYYTFKTHRNYMVDLVCRMLLHLFPAAIVDSVAYLAGHKPTLWKTYKKIHKFCGVISYFATKEWRFNNDATLTLLNKLNATDRKTFNFDLKLIDWNEYFRYHIVALQMYLIEEPDNYREEGFKKQRRLKVAHYSFVTIGYLLMFWVIMKFLLYLWSLFTLVN